MTEGKLLDLAGVAAHIGTTYKTVRAYHGRAERGRRDGTSKPGDLPEPDAHFGHSPVWRVSTIDHWYANRPGRGAGGGRPPRKDSP